MKYEIVKTSDELRKAIEILATQPVVGEQSLAWSGRRPRVVLLGSGDRRPEIANGIEQLRPKIARCCDIVLEDFSYSADLTQLAADFAVVFGGDGSILRAARMMGEHQIPVVGVNFGKLGFLADLLPDDLIPALEQVVAGSCQIVSHLMLRCQIVRNQRSGFFIATCRALTSCLDRRYWAILG